ncbi:PAS domain S-box-containing protein [Roseimicrobium gellanilyticum]|uniref:histidine kinase n=1 Tax=Roseimicrobium gellanilyticum TaxID=748857 RepID=A0A366HH54_9BACT|nr:PAS domain S-box protein [Roseimicrobium gellanilyticum]RBP41511.1 PAS domain S-box-containing protein [Roseimicrobium gellanilyticum]
MTDAKNASLPDEAGFISPALLLSAIVSSSDDAIVSKNLSGIITSWNPGAERIFGYSAEEAIGRSITMVIPEERQDEERQILEKIRSGQRVEHFDTVRRRKDGTEVHVSLTISPIKDPDGKIVGASKIARNITQRKLAEELARKQRAKLEVINQVGTSLVAERDLSVLVQAITDAGKELSGAAFGAFFYTAHNEQGEVFTLYTLSGAPREAFEKFGIPRNTPIFEPTFRGTGVVRVPDVTLDPRYGKMPPHHGMPKGHLPVRSYLAVPVASRSGEVIGGLFFGHPEPDVFKEDAEAAVVALAAQAAVAIENARLYDALERELTQQRVMERALRESEALSTSVLNSSADCIKVMDLEGRLSSMNTPGIEAFDLGSFDDVKGKLWSDLWVEEMRDEVQRAVAQAAAGSTSRFNGPCVTAKGVSKWWDVIVTPLRDADGKVNRLTATSRDITEQRKTSEEALASAAEAERQSRMKDEFLATLSHELRTPLQSILGWTQMLRSGVCEEGELEQGLEVIDRNAQAQTKIIEDLLDMSRILSGKVRLDVQRVQVASVIESALETVKPAADAKNIRLQSILDPLARPISGDPARLQQVFWNLLSNAIKFTPRDGRVQILLERVNSHLEVVVTDTGCGIEADFLPYVFERFRQADASTTRRHGGLGLGLAIVKNLTELHGGTARVKSPGVGQGSTFVICLPLAPIHVEPDDGSRRHPDAVNGERTMAPPPKLDGISVLVVDDEEDARMLIAKMLAKAGAQVHKAGSAKEAIEELKRILPDVLISDIGMPVADGYSLIRSVRALPAELGGRVPAIALSAYTRTEDRIRSISEGFQIHLSKPADAVELLAVVQSLFNATRNVRE